VDSIFRALAVYVVLLVIFRIAGKRALSQATTFDLVLALIISEAIQQALVDRDGSLTGAFLVVVTLVGADVLFSVVKQRWERFDRIVEGTPVTVVEQGKPLRDRMRRERVDDDDILEAARELRGITTLGEIERAVVERSGQITVVPKRG
jgi:uncharacterized membrane protein YcaP (DUF421 family)